MKKYRYICEKCKKDIPNFKKECPNCKCKKFVLVEKIINKG